VSKERIENKLVIEKWAKRIGFQPDVIIYKEKMTGNIVTTIKDTTNEQIVKCVIWISENDKLLDNLDSIKRFKKRRPKE